MLIHSKKSQIDQASLAGANRRSQSGKNGKKDCLKNLIIESLKDALAKIDLFLLIKSRESTKKISCRWLNRGKKEGANFLC